MCPLDNRRLLLDRRRIDGTAPSTRPSVLIATIKRDRNGKGSGSEYQRGCDQTQRNSQHERTSCPKSLFIRDRDDGPSHDHGRGHASDRHRGRDHANGRHHGHARA